MLKKFSKVVLLPLLFVLTINVSTYATIDNLPLRRGMSGSDVTELQEILIEMGFDIFADGVYGLETEKIIKDFQLSQNLFADGVVGAKTLAKMKEVTENVEYEVQSGDTLSEIAEQFNITTSDVKNANKLNGDRIYVGQILSIPRRGVGDGSQDQVYKHTIHVVQSGDALLKLSKRYGVSVDTIKNANNIKSHLIQVGQKLVIPYLQVYQVKIFDFRRVLLSGLLMVELVHGMV